MPRITKYFDYCDNCETETGDPVILSVSGDLFIQGPGWGDVVYAQGELYFCSPQCLLSWLTEQIKAALRGPDDRCLDGTKDFVDQEDEFYSAKHAYPETTR